MPVIDRMGLENARYGICGFTSTLYAVFKNKPRLRGKLDRATTTLQLRTSRMQAEIKTFLYVLKGEGKTALLRQIEQLTQSFPGYGGWTVDGYLDGIKQGTLVNYSIAMPPEPLMEYMKSTWSMKPSLLSSFSYLFASGDFILGLTRTGAPVNAWKNLAHYVYLASDGTIYSWGERFTSLSNLNQRKHRSYSIVYRISVGA